MRNLLTYIREWIKMHPKKTALIVGAMLAIVTGIALAGSATVTWTHPTQNTDGSALPLSQITGTRVEWGTCSGTAFGTKAGEVVLSGTATTTTIDNLAPGNTCFRGFTRANGNEGAASNVVAKVIPSPTPGAPTLVSVSVVAFDVRWSWKEFGYVLNRNVGTVPLGTACSADFTLADGYARVDRKAVKFSRRTISPVIVARCA